MSTKSTIDFNWGSMPEQSPARRTTDPSECDPALPDFHLYAEAFEPDAVYLRVACEFDADNLGVTVRLPVALWNRLVAHGPRPEPEKGGAS